ncbi:MAG TPA: hypothetical protein VGM36_05935, partial [Rhizomicrobium sp.]
GKPDAALQAVSKIGISILSQPAKGNRDGEYALLCPNAKLADAITILRRRGAAGSVTAQTMEYVFETEDPLVAAFERLMKV